MIKLCLLGAALLSQQGTIPDTCVAIERDEDRLRCYDEYFRGAEEKDHVVKGEKFSSEGPRPLDEVSNSTDGKTVVVPPPPLDSSTERRIEDEFGLTQAQLDARTGDKPPEQRLDKIEARVRGVERMPSGRLVLTLENGQRWIELETSSRPRFFSGDVVRIRKAALGSYLASGPRSGTGIRVRRID